jgi:hypothetical protein
MMLPRAGGRDFGDTAKILQRLYERNVAAWEEDQVTFTKGFKKRGGATKPKAKKAAKGATRKAPKVKTKKKAARK